MSKNRATALMILVIILPVLLTTYILFRDVDNSNKTTKDLVLLVRVDGVQNADGTVYGDYDGNKIWNSVLVYLRNQHRFPGNWYLINYNTGLNVTGQRVNVYASAKTNLSNSTLSGFFQSFWKTITTRDSNSNLSMLDIQQAEGTPTMRPTNYDNLLAVGRFVADHPPISLKGEERHIIVAVSFETNLQRDTGSSAEIVNLGSIFESLGAAKNKDTFHLIVLPPLVNGPVPDLLTLERQSLSVFYSAYQKLMDDQVKVLFKYKNQDGKFDDGSLINDLYLASLEEKPPVKYLDFLAPPNRAEETITAFLSRNPELNNDTGKLMRSIKQDLERNFPQFRFFDVVGMFLFIAFCFGTLFSMIAFSRYHFRVNRWAIIGHIAACLIQAALVYFIVKTLSSSSYVLDIGLAGSIAFIMAGACLGYLALSHIAVFFTQTGSKFHRRAVNGLYAILLDSIPLLLPATEIFILLLCPVTDTGITMNDLDLLPKLLVVLLVGLSSFLLFGLKTISYARGKENIARALRSSMEKCWPKARASAVAEWSRRLESTTMEQHESLLSTIVRPKGFEFEGLSTMDLEDDPQDLYLEGSVQKGWRPSQGLAMAMASSSLVKRDFSAEQFGEMLLMPFLSPQSINDRAPFLNADDYKETALYCALSLFGAISRIFQRWMPSAHFTATNKAIDLYEKSGSAFYKYFDDLFRQEMLSLVSLRHDVRQRVASAENAIRGLSLDNDLIIVTDLHLVGEALRMAKRLRTGTSRFAMVFVIQDKYCGLRRIVDRFGAYLPLTGRAPVSQRRKRKSGEPYVIPVWLEIARGKTDSNIKKALDTAISR